MKQNKKEVSDKLLKCAIESITESNIDFENDLYDLCRDYFDECYDESFKGKSLPSKSHIVKLILQDINLKNSIEMLAEHAAEELMAAFACAEENSAEYEKEAAEEKEEEAQLKIKQTKLLSSFSKEQIFLLKETFNISV